MSNERELSRGALAVEIAAHLFINGQGEEADRLVLTAKDGSDLGGWCQMAVIDVIRQVLNGKVTR